MPGTNPGSPLQHVQTALNNAHYGDTVNIQAGTYREQVFLPIPWTLTAGTGSPANMLTVQAWDTNNDGIIESGIVRFCPTVPTHSATILLVNVSLAGALADPRALLRLSNLYSGLRAPVCN